MAFVTLLGFVVACVAAAYYRTQAVRHGALSDSDVGGMGSRYWRRHLIAGVVALAFLVAGVLFWPK